MDGHINITSMEQNYFKLFALLTEIFPLVLRRFLEDQLQRAGYSSFIDLLNHEKHRFYHCLHPGRRNPLNVCCCGSNKESQTSITIRQWKLLYVDTGNSKACTYRGRHPCKYEANPVVKLEDMDLSLLLFMIDKIFPGTTALDNIRKLSNGLIHPETIHISDITFRQMWFSARSSILQIANTIAAPFPSEVQQNINRVEEISINIAELETGTDKLVKITSANGIEILNGRCFFNRETGEWTMEETDDDIPTEIRWMDQRSEEIFISALKKGRYKSYHIRLMFVGHFGVGKTSLAMRLLEKYPFDKKITSTNGIEILNGRSFYNRETGEWVIEETARKLASASEIIARDIFEPMNKKRKESDQAETTDEDKSADNPLETEETSYPRKGLDKKTEEYNVEDENKASASVHGHSSRSARIILLEETINAKLKKTNEGDEFLVPVDIWDFGGQAAFYTSHQIFLTDRSIYLLAFNASRDLEDEVQDQSLDVGGKGKSSVREFLQFWISSIKTYTGKHTKGSPKIILIGTHWDFVPQEKRREWKEEIKTLISEHFREELDQEQLVMKDELFFNVTDPKDGGHGALKAEIIRQAESQSYWGEELPKTWLPLRDNLFHMKQNDEKIVSKQNVTKMNEKSCTPLKNDELDVFLNFLHSLGHILYFNVADLKDHVILDPQWTIDALKSLITAELFCKEDGRKYEAWRNMSKQGILTEETITSLWSREEYQQFALHRSHLLKTMEKLDLVVKPMTYDESGKVCETDYYYVPCMLKESYPEDRSCFVEQLLRGSASLQCIFQRKLLPLVVYNRLVAACIGNWPVLDNHLYFGLCLLKLDTFHNLILQKSGHVIEIFVSHRRGKNCVSKRLCRGIEDIIMSMLKKIIIVYKANLFISETGSEEDEEGLPFTLQWQSDIQESIEDLQCECPDDCSGLPQSALESTPTDVELSRLSACLGPGQLYPVAIELGLSELEVDAIRHDNRCHRDVVFHVLQLWRNRTSMKKASIKTLISAFTEMGDVDQHTFCKIYRIYDEAAIDTEDLPKNKRRIIPSDEILHATAVYINDKFLHVAMEISIPCNEMKKNGHIIQITVSHTRGKSFVIKSNCRWIEDFIMSMLKKITLVNKSGAGQYGEDLPFTLQWQSDIQETVEDRYFECSKDCEGFSKEALELKPSDLQLYRLSTLLNPRHVSWLAIELGIRDVELNEIKEDNSSDSRFVILERWRNRASKREAKFKTLQAAFRSIGDIDQHIFCQKEEKYAIDPEDLPADKGTRKPSDKLLSEAVMHVGTKYFHVAMEIGIPCTKMNFIQMEHQGNLHVRILEMLKYWRQNSIRATVKDLALAIRIAGSDYSGFCEMVNATK